MAGLVAGEHIEYVSDKGVTGRIAPGEELPRDMKVDDITALRKGGAIVTAKEYTDRTEQQRIESNRDRIRREAEAAGLKVTG